MHFTQNYCFMFMRSKNKLFLFFYITDFSLLLIYMLYLMILMLKVDYRKQRIKVRFLRACNCEHCQIMKKKKLEDMKLLMWKKKKAGKKSALLEIITLPKLLFCLLVLPSCPWVWLWIWMAVCLCVKDSWPDQGALQLGQAPASYSLILNKWLRKQRWLE